MISQVVDEGAQVIVDGNNSYDTDGNRTHGFKVREKHQSSIADNLSFGVDKMKENQYHHLELNTTYSFLAGN